MHSLSASMNGRVLCIFSHYAGNRILQKEGRAMNSGLQPPIPAGGAWEYAFLNLSIPDIVVVVLMVVVFILALVIPFPSSHDG